jgi:hypothetical protein
MKNITMKDWIESTVFNSENEWAICTFTARGTFIDARHNTRNVINSLSMPRFIKGIDWTVSTARRKLKFKEMKFIPFIGGSKDFQVSGHVHALYEVPKGRFFEMYDFLKPNFETYLCRALKEDVKGKVWINRLDYSKLSNHLFYCMRYEDDTYMSGNEKVLIESKSCFL